MDILNNCPNCKSSYISISNFILFKDRWIIECLDCHFAIVKDGEKKAIKAWNNLSKAKD